ncbi:putative membrane protein [Candidatus Kuenenia stuttgartiensis]|jgi:hypothetical protein|uniref:Putative membrane protein n=1 Tax=Kuenenia stuttgartiensis TaxID=174633 RepID=Q1PY56_KUEST|nr:MULTISPECIES: hypothetical protein [Kuenenia]MBE7546311.1 hypothetical protein [Planctomycetia bacterium]MBZ0192026.1 hypothetical protein [Candidatus Kuenenia stuttgartiensis]MCF6151200.1 hypothetical protein [Candidatus Kuenenia stuttgartiensis]MCL4725804.1 hypothetical protein [Candidatus Kuenenia stuttgartiensis]MCZ7623337.1 hypothetical protein [Candidatus Kuenenia sp.]
MVKTKTHVHSWRDIFVAFKMAFDPKMMFLGYAGLLISLAWCMTAASFFSALKIINLSPFFFTKIILSPMRDNCPIHGANFSSAAAMFSVGGFIFFITIALGLLAIWSFFGGAITRIAALDYARDENVRLIDAVIFARKKFWSFFWSPMIPFIGVFFFGICNVIGGLIGRIPVLGECVVALGFPFAFVAGLLMVLVGIIGVLGMCFMYPTISAEGSDAFDAVSRAYSYVISRPKRFLGYCGIYIVYGIICVSIVAFFAWLVIHLSFCTVGFGMGEKFYTVKAYILQRYNIACLGFCMKPADESKAVASVLAGWSLKFLAGMLIVYIFCIKLAVWNFFINYVFSAKTVIYFLLRKEIDSTNVTDVYLENNSRNELTTDIKNDDIKKLSENTHNDDVRSDQFKE